ncbi:MAG: DUF370 domain-containing protein [Clostridia bacterium]|nr:DUF370 domain-containing protein [Clostridia bacterium]MDR3645137.1 DUF370 domain-containing protein [Clostridia bacterium]
MYLHIGHDTVIRHKDIVGIFDIDTASVSKQTRDYLAGAQKKGLVVNVTNELPKSFVVCTDRKQKAGYTVYISQISSTTLLKRTDFLEELSDYL